MSLISQLKGFVSTAKTAAKEGAKQMAREAVLPELVFAKKAELAKVNQELGKLGWSASPDVKARKAELNGQKTQLQAELGKLEGELQAATDRTRANRDNVLKNMR